jgi:hypothetical protein
MAKHRSAETSKERKQHRRAAAGNQPPAASSSWRTGAAAAVLVAVLAAAGARWYRQNYPTEQRCPPPEDRFHDHCMEGRKHYMISIDWDCIGKQNARYMKLMLGLPEDTRTRGVGTVPSWLTEENADAIRKLECARGLVVDLACNHCKNTPRLGKKQDGESNTTQPTTASDDEK